MVKTYVDSGAKLEYTAGGTIASGAMVLEGKTVGVSEGAYVSGDTVVLNIMGKFRDQPLVQADEPVTGERLYWNGTALTLTATSNEFAGICAKDAPGTGAGDILVDIILAGVSSPLGD